MRNRDMYNAMHDKYQAEGNLAYMLDVYGDTIAAREGYKSVNGIDAVHYYIIHKFHWLPSQVKSMSSEDLRFVLSEEMHGWSLPLIAEVSKHSQY